MGKIWLTGMMGSGKSTVAPLVGARLGWSVLDTDSAIEAVAGRRIVDWIPADVDGFRTAEREVVRECADATGDLVVACGGGVVLDPVSVDMMRSTGMVTYLDVEVPQLVERIGTGEGRPLLGGDLAASLRSLQDQRDELYRLAAHRVVSADGSPESIADAVVSAWLSWS